MEDAAEGTFDELVWSKDKVLKLIEMYRERPLLWNATNSFYKDKNKKNYAWLEIADELIATKADVKTKIRNLTTQFKRENKKTKSGSGVDSEKRKWFALDHLMFLKDTTAPRHCRDTAKHDSMPENIDESADTTLDTPSPGPSTPLQSTLTKPPKRRRYNPVAQEALSVMKNLGDKIKPRDEFDAFGEYVAGQLRKCTDLRQMAVTKHRINQALFDLEIANLPSNQPTPNISTPSRMSYETDESVSLLDNYFVHLIE
ncbi:hypothetical protein J6590_049984 [Homalodisca vitripennis]|nr:hypothetical protein J6590_049984 [Homalodisca vitripennis]